MRKHCWFYPSFMLLFGWCGFRGFALKGCGMSVYRDLRDGETLQAGDEWLHLQKNQWWPVDEIFYGMTPGEAFRTQYRRPVRPHWRRPDELLAHSGLRDGDRIVAVAKWTDHVCTNTEDWPESITKVLKPHLLVLRITDESPGAVDTELQDYTQHDCERWMPESEFLQLLNDLEGGAP